MRVIVAGHDRLGIVMADMLSDAGHDVLIVDEDGRRVRSFPGDLVARPNVEVFVANPTLDDTMVAMDIRTADLFVAALRTPAENGLVSLKAKMTYGVPQVLAVVTSDALRKIYEGFGIRTVNPYTLAMSDLHETLKMNVEADQDADVLAFD